MIRDAGAADINRLREVFRSASLSNEGDRPALLANPEVLEFDDTCVREHRTRIAEREGRVVGFASVTPNGDAVELDDIFVDPEWTRRGVGLELMRDLSDAARAKGVLRIEVTANHHALAFYEAAGFAPDGVAETRFGPALRMHLDLS
jgi:N-acetylglutamate synthase-like GNAT family acetyltransferase